MSSSMIALRRSTVLTGARASSHAGSSATSLVRVGADAATAMPITESAASVAAHAARTQEMAVTAGVGAIVGGIAAKIMIGGTLGPIALGVVAGALLGAGLNEIYNVTVKGQGW